MNIQILAERKGKAMDRIVASADGVSKARGVPDHVINGLVATNKDKDVEAMLRMEAVADLMEWLLPQKTNNNTEPMSDVDQILALPAAKVIEFVETQADADYLSALLAGEEAGKKRKSVIAAIAEKLTAPE